MLVEDFAYELPQRAIAQRPLSRGASKLLVMDAKDEARHRKIDDLPKILQPGDLLVVNDTRVLAARIFARRGQGGKSELLLVEKQGELEWDALVRPGRRSRPGSVLALEDDGPRVEILEKGGDGRHRVRFSRPIEPYLKRAGHVPLPPYIKRPDEAADHRTYQTVFARHEGSIAAPTAGLHFHRALLEQLAAHGIRRASVTLHVGIGTFKPVTAPLVHEHHMEEESYEVPQRTARRIAETRSAGGRIVAVGTTVVRTLEAAAGGGGVHPGAGRTGLFITPGYRFRVVDVLLTNFHLPRSTLLMLVSALAGRDRVLAAYEEALERGYRFYSYGDAMLAERADPP